MQKKTMKREDQDNRPAFNFLRPFGAEDFPELAEKQGLHTLKREQITRPYKDKTEQ